MLSNIQSYRACFRDCLIPHRLSNWDPDVFYKFRDVILQQVPTCTIKLRSDLCRNLPYIWANHFILDKDKDVAFEVSGSLKWR